MKIIGIGFRRHMRFSLSTLLLTTTLFAVVCGWLVERYKLRTKLEVETSEVASVNANLSAATFANRIYSDLDQLSPEDFERRKRHTLLTVIYSLWQTEESEAQNQQGLSLMHAGNSLALLNCTDVDQVRQMVRDAGFVPEIESPFLDPNHVLYDDLADFITRACVRRRREPTQPIRTWLQAVKNGDRQELRTAFSSRVQKRFDEEGWEERLKGYQEAFATEFGDYGLSEFSFKYTTDGDRDGHVTVFRKGREFRELRITKENDRWKIDKP